MTQKFPIVPLLQLKKNIYVYFDIYKKIIWWKNKSFINWTGYENFLKINSYNGFIIGCEKYRS